MSKKVVVVGSINLDLVVRAPRIPVAGETLIGTEFQTFPGGKGANQAVAAARLGAEVAIIGKLGKDAFGRELKGGLEQAGVNTTTLGLSERPSGVALITTDASGNNSITVIPGANHDVLPSDVDANRDLIWSAGFVLAQLEIPLQTVKHLAGICSERGVPFMLDPAPAQGLPDALLQQVTWLTPNETETCQLLGLGVQELTDELLEGSAAALFERGCGNVILKLGARGCYVALADGTRKLVSGYKVRAVDTTAAGDAFNGALAVAMLSGKDPIAAARWASAVAAVSVTRPGAQPSMPTLSEVERFLEQMPSN